MSSLDMNDSRLFPQNLRLLHSWKKELSMSLAQRRRYPSPHHSIERAMKRYGPGAVEEDREWYPYDHDRRLENETSINRSK